MKEVTRRALLIGMCGMAFGGRLMVDDRKSPGTESAPANAVMEMYTASSNTTDVCLKFLDADFPTLTTAYATFFPQLLVSSEPLQSIIDAVKLSPNHSNRHRLEALPAITASHLLPITRNGDQQDKLQGT